MKRIAMLPFCLCLYATSFAQQQELTSSEKLEQRTQMLESAVKTLQKLKISGYIQAQYQWGEQDAVLKVGTINTDISNPYNRIGIRRGRIKFAYDERIFGGVFQIDLTEKGLKLKDAYLSVKDPWIGTNTLKAGVFDRPFGNEINYSSSRRESPERSTLFQTLFPDERDLGASLTLQVAKTSPWNFLKIEAGLFAGNGINPETDNRKDFIGYLSASNNIGSDAKYGLGLSYYNGSVIQLDQNVYTMQGKNFVLNNDDSNVGGFAKREYVGFDGQFSIMTPLGMSQIRVEYLFGTQPGSHVSSKSPNYASIVLKAIASTVLPGTPGAITDTYIRNFSGYYVIFVQDIGTLPFSAVLKYDYYDHNTKISGNEIGVTGSNTNVVDLAQSTFGFGLLWRASNSIRVQAYYEINKNETSENLVVYKEDRKDDVFTLRLQYKF